MAQKPMHQNALSMIVRSRIRHLNPGCFALVMATGIVSIDVSQHGMTLLAQALFGLNLLAYAVLLVMTTLRLLHFPRELLADFVSTGRGAGFLTLAAGTCVLGSQCLLVVPLPRLADGLLLAGAVSWVGLVYLFLAATITARIKPGFTRSINGGWLVAVVATQALAVLLVLRTASVSPPNAAWLFTALCLYLLGAALYLLIITLVVYRLVFSPCAPAISPRRTGSTWVRWRSPRWPAACWCGTSRHRVRWRNCCRS